MTTERRISPYVGAKLRALDAELGRAIPRVMESRDDEAIHDMRVAIRRLRTMLKLVRKVYGSFHTDSVRRAFTDVHRATGALRDEEVLEETLDTAAERSAGAGPGGAASLAEHPSFHEWRARRRGLERKLRRAVLDRMARGELTRARAMLKALLLLPVEPHRDANLGKFARRCAKRARRGIDRLRDTPVEDVEGLHQLRIAFKELRYACELLGQALPADVAALAEPAAKFQKRLGEIHDVDVALATARRARGLTPEARDTLLAHLTEMRAKRVAKYVNEMHPAAEPANPPPPEPQVRQEAGTEPDRKISTFSSTMS